MLGVGLADPVEELRADDAAAAPDRRHRAEVELPAVRLRRRAHLREPLGVGDDLRRVQRFADVVDEVVGHAALPGRGPASVDAAALRSSRNDESVRGEHGLGDPGRAAPRGPARPARSSGRCPSARPGRGSRRRAACRCRVGLLQHDRRDLDEERLQVARVPLLEDLADGRGVEPADVGEQVVRLRDELDVGVLDAVVHHLDVVARPVRPDVHAARRAVDVGRDRGEHLLDLGVGRGVAAGHDARPVERPLLAAGHARCP